ncbi:MAG: hypothetical protein ACP6KW_07640 [Candidatus Thorarchaeota archaeon]
MDLGESILGLNSQTQERLVRGCPCYREFGEPVCLNDDDVMPVSAISVDTSFFDHVRSHLDLEETKSDSEGMCYLLIFLDRTDGYCYCVSQNRPLMIDGKHVTASDIDGALQFVTNTEKSSDGLLCSECLYKYLRTLGEASEGYLTNSEREAIIGQYIKEVGYRMASELSGTTVEDPLNVTESQKNPIRKRIQEVSKSRSRWASVLLRLKRGGTNGEVIDLIDNYRSLHRLEAVFLHQVLQLDEDTEHNNPSTNLRFMQGTSRKLLSLTQAIRRQTETLVNEHKVDGELKTLLLRSAEKRREMEPRFNNLASVLSEIGARTTSQ